MKRHTALALAAAVVLGGEAWAGNPEIPVKAAGSPSPGRSCPPSPERSWRARYDAWKHRTCYVLEHTIVGIPEEFDEPPMGAYVRAHTLAMARNAQAANFCLYLHDFAAANSARLNRDGADHLAAIARQLPTVAFPVVIERTDNPNVAIARRQVILDLLNRGPFPVPPERVVIGPGVGEGLSGNEGLLIDNNLLDQSKSRGGATSGSGITTGGTGGVPGASSTGVGH